MKKILTIAVIILIVFFGFPKLFAYNYFNQIKSVAGVEVVDNSLLNLTTNMFDKITDTLLDSKFEETYNNISAGDKIKVKIDNIDANGIFRGIITNDSKQNQFVLTIEKYDSQKTFRIPVNTVTFQ